MACASRTSWAAGVAMQQMQLRAAQVYGPVVTYCSCARNAVGVLVAAKCTALCWWLCQLMVAADVALYTARLCPADPWPCSALHFCCTGSFMPTKKARSCTVCFEGEAVWGTWGFDRIQSLQAAHTRDVHSGSQETACLPLGMRRTVRMSAACRAYVHCRARRVQLKVQQLAHRSER